MLTATDGPANILSPLTPYKQHPVRCQQSYRLLSERDLDLVDAAKD